MKRLIGFLLLMLGLYLATAPAFAQDGSMDLEGNCNRQGALLQLTEFSTNGFRCLFPDGTYVKINLVQLCQNAYGTTLPYPTEGSPYEPFSLSCKSTVETGVNELLPIPPQLGGVDLETFCRYSFGERAEAKLLNQHLATGWKCITDKDGKIYSFNAEAMKMVCRWQYPWFRGVLFAYYTDPFNPNSWVCEPTVIVR